MQSRFFTNPNYCKGCVIAAAAIFCILMAAIILCCSAVHAGSTGTAEQRVECFISIQVHDGESVWEISSRYYSSEYHSMRRYIKKIMNINHMTNEQIDAGSFLIIPYYVNVTNER